MKNEWKIKKLGEVGNIFSGNSINEKVKKTKYLNLKEGMPYVATRDVSYENEINYDNGVKIPQKDLDKFRIAHKDSVFICAEGGSAGRKLAFNTQDVCFVNKLFAFEAGKSIEPKFAYYFYQSDDFQKQFKSRMTGLIGGVSMGKFKEINISYPDSLEEQKQIVKILDEVFKSITKSKENAEKNLKNAKELFESYLEEIFSNPKQDWEEKRLGEIAEVEYGFTGKARTKGDFRYVRITDTNNDGLLTEEGKVYLEKSKEAEKFILNNEDLLMARTGATFAKVLFYEDKEPSIFASYLIRIKFNKKILNKLYWYFSKSRNYWNQANSLSSGSAQPHFNGHALKEVIFTFPSNQEEQKVIVQKLDALSKEIKELESIYNQKVKDLEELKKSMLQKAFSGELTNK